MKSVGAMIAQLSAMVGTNDLNGWETGFVENLAERTGGGKNTLHLSEPQVDKLRQLYTKHFGDVA